MQPKLFYGMRKILLLLIISLSLTVGINGQTLVGLQGYYTLTKLSTDSAELNRLQTLESGYGGGVAIKHFELGPIGFQGELNFEKSAFGFKNDTIANIFYRQDLTYVSADILMQLDIGKHAFHIVGALGPYVNVLIDAPDPETTPETVMSNGFSKLYMSDFNRVTFGLLGEAGFAIATKVGVFQLTGRAKIGMSKLMHFEGIALFNTTIPKSFGIGLHYFVPFGEEKYATKKLKTDQDTLVSDLELLSDSLNTVSDTTKAVNIKDSQPKVKKEKSKKDKKKKKAPETEQPVADESATESDASKATIPQDSKLDSDGTE